MVLCRIHHNAAQCPTFAVERTMGPLARSSHLTSLPHPLDLILASIALQICSTTS